MEKEKAPTPTTIKKYIPVRNHLPTPIPTPIPIPIPTPIPTPMCSPTCCGMFDNIK